MTLGGVGAGVALVVAVSIINATLEASIGASVTSVGRGAALEVAAPTDNGLPSETLRAVRRLPEAHQVVPVLRNSSYITSPRGGRERTLIFGTTFGITDFLPKQRPGLRLAMLPLDLHRSARIIYPSATLAERLHIGRGDRLELRTPRGVVRIRVATPLPPSALAGAPVRDAALMPFAEAQRLFGKGADHLLVTPTRGVSMTALTSALRGPAAGTVVGPPGTAANTAKATFRSISAITQQTTVASLIVGILVVLNTMQMAIMERRRELAVLETIGVGPTALGVCLGIEAAVVGVVAGCLGTAGGLALAAAVVGHVLDAYSALPFIADAQLQVAPMDLVAGVVVGSAIAVVGAVPPALRIMRTWPSQLLRPLDTYEWQPSRASALAEWIGPAGVVLCAMSAMLAIAGGANRVTVNLAVVSALTGAALLIRRLAPAVTSRCMMLVGRRRGVAVDLAARSPGRTSLMLSGLVVAAGTMVGLAVGLASYERAIQSVATAFYGAPLWVKAPGPGPLTSDQRFPSSIVSGLADVPGVRAAYPVRFSLMTDGQRQTLVYAVPATEAARSGDIIVRPKGAGTEPFLADLAAGRAVPSGILVRRRALGAGGSVRLLAGTHSAHVRLGGAFDDAVSTDSLFIDGSQYRRLWADNTADRVAIEPAEGVSVSTLVPHLERYLAAHGGAGEVLTRRQMVEFTTTSLEGLFSLARAIQSAALILAGLIVATTMATITLERRREFALQRLVGLTNTQLGRAILVETLILGVLGSVGAALLGIPLGALMGLVIQDQIGWRAPLDLPIQPVAGVFVVTIVLSVAAALYPAARAARRPIVASLDLD